MATENPKVSGYVPQVVFDCLQDFKEKRSLKSISLALTVALSEYFQVDYKVDHQSSLLSTGNYVSKEQFEALETRFSELSSGLLSEISSLRRELLLSLSKSIEIQTVNVESEPSSELPNEPLKDELLSELPDELLGDKPPSELKSDLPQLELQIGDPVLEQDTSVTSFLLSGQHLAKRLSIANNAVSAKKREALKEESLIQDFYNWLQDKDPDGISWVPMGGSLKGYSKGWIPSEDTPSELLSRLQEWLLANPNLQK
jgi:hypothetical protein